MQSVKVLTHELEGDRSIADRWYVSDGSTAVGPVDLDLLARGVEAGRVPLESFIRHEQWKVWKPLVEVAVVTSDDAAPADRFDVRGEWPSPTPFLAALDQLEAAHFAQSIDPAEIDEAFRDSDDVEATPAFEAIEEPLPQFAEEEPLPEWTDDISEPARATRADEILASDAIDGASDAKEAMLLFLTAAIERCEAEGAIVHSVDEQGAVASCAHGPRMFELLGSRVKLLDPSFVAAAARRLVVAEPAPGPAGTAMTERLARLGVPTEGAVMMPIHAHGHLAAFVELGKSTPFSPRQLAKLGDLGEALEMTLDRFPR